MKSNKRLFLSPVIIVIIFVLAACQAVPRVIATEPPANSNPVFLATPDPGNAGKPVPLPTQDSGLKENPTENEPHQGDLGELYFVINDIRMGSLSLARLPGECAGGITPCPEPEIIPGFPNISESVRPLVWSPDASSALLPYGDFLFRFDPALGTWKPVAQTGVQDLAQWSPDGERIAWIALTAQGLDVFTARPDGSGLQNLTGGRYAGEGQNLAQLTWIGSTNISFWVFKQGQPKELLQMNVDTGETAPLIQMAEMTKDTLAFSPDRRRVAIESFVEGDTNLKIGNTDGSEMSTVGTYGAASIWPMSWSPNGKWVVYAVYKSADVDPLTHVYLAAADGSQEAREIFQAENVSALVWAPDSQSLVAQADQDGQTRLFAILVPSVASTPITFPGLENGMMLQGISWR